MKNNFKPVLVVEDDIDIRDTLQLILEEDRYPVMLAKNGQEALQVLSEREPPGLILLDIQMPVMDGKSFLKKIREQHESPLSKIPVVVLTAGGLQKIDPEPDDYLSKPVNIDRLMGVIEKYCRS